MKPVATFFKICLLLSWLTACVDAPEPTQSVPTSTQRPASTPTPTAQQTEIPNTPETVEIADLRFSYRSITVGLANVAAADFDNDGHQDLVSAGEPQITIFLGDGEGNLINSSQVPGGKQPDSFALADLDEDGDIDIVIANHDTDYLTLLLGSGDGAFQPAPGSPLRVDVLPHPHVVRAVDLDSDGHVDLVVDHRQGEGLLILRGLGEGIFDSPGILVKVGGDPYRGMAVGDIDGDGKPDLVTPNPGEAGILLNVSSERMAFVQASPVPAEAPFAVELGDFNGDGRLDLIAASDEGSSLVELFLGDGHGGFEEADDSPFTLAPGGKSIVLGDFNGDDITDAAVASYNFADVLVLLGGRGSIRTGYLPGGEHPWGMAAADFNEDGKDDLIIADDASHRAVLYLSFDQ